MTGKYLLTVLFFLIKATPAFADCDAPALNLKFYNESIYGYKVEKIWDIADETKKKPDDFDISFGDYKYRFVSDGKKNQVKKIILTKNIVYKIKSSFQADPTSENEKQAFLLHGEPEGFDLNNDANADVVLFNVTSGANIYSGAIGIIRKELVTLVPPGCY